VLLYLLLSLCLPNLMELLATCLCNRNQPVTGMVRESKSPHSTPTFCVRKPNGKWRIVHAFNKLNAAIISAHVTGRFPRYKSR
jgi:hypothetical protein